MTRILGGAIALFLLATLPALADPVKIGLLTTLSGPGGYPGEDVRDAFNLAIAEEDGKLGGIPVALSVEDDALKPGTGKQIVERYLGDNMKIITGIIFSNVLEAIEPDVVEAGAFYISPNAGPTPLAGKSCNKNYFVASWANDSMNGSAGANAARLGYKRMFVMAPNYQAGKDAIEGFKRYYGKAGEIVGEIYTRLDQTDFSAEIAQIRAAKPDALFQFEPGALGIAFAKQYVQAGLKDSIPLVLPITSMDARIMAATGDASLGLHISTFWNLDFDNPANKRFVADFRKTYHRDPTAYAAQAYDTARLIGSALKAVGGDMAKSDDFRTALRKADFESVRGAFKFAPNQHPIQNWYSMLVEKDASGKLVTRTEAQIETNQVDPFGKDCHM